MGGEGMGGEGLGGEGLGGEGLGGEGLGGEGLGGEGLGGECLGGEGLGGEGLEQKRRTSSAAFYCLVRLGPCRRPQPPPAQPLPHSVRRVRGALKQNRRIVRIGGYMWKLE